MVGILLSGCGAGSPGGVAAGARPGTAGGWPATGQVIAAPCPRAYPDRLATAQVAFDGTVTAVGLDEVVPKAGDRRAHVQFAVHEVFTGSPGNGAGPSDLDVLPAPGPAADRRAAGAGVNGAVDKRDRRLRLLPTVVALGRGSLAGGVRLPLRFGCAAKPSR